MLALQQGSEVTQDKKGLKTTDLDDGRVELVEFLDAFVLLSTGFVTGVTVQKH